MKPRLQPAHTLIAALALGSITAPGTPLHAQGAYAPVTEADVREMKLNHYFSADKRSHEPDFEWRFFPEEFVLKSARGPIPKDLLEKLLLNGAAGEEIRGKWRLDSKRGDLVLTDLKAGNKAARMNVAFPIYRTAPTVIRVGQPQYVFALEP